MSCAIKDATVEVAIATLAQAAGVGAAWRTPTLVYVGDLGPEDNAVLFRRVRRGSQQQVQSMVQVVSTPQGNVTVTPDGLVIASDVLPAIQAMENLISQVESIKTPVWFVEVFGVQSQRSFERRLKVEGSPVATVALALSSQGAGSALASATFNAFLEFVDKANDASVEFRPVLLLMDGESASIGASESRYLERRSFTDQGQAVSNGFQAIEAGTILRVELREQDDSYARLRLSLDVTAFAGSGGNGQRVQGLQLEAPILVRSGVPYLVGAFDDHDVNVSKSRALSLGRGVLDKESAMSVWVKATRVDVDEGVADVSVVGERSDVSANERSEAGNVGGVDQVAGSRRVVVPRPVAFQR